MNFLKLIWVCFTIGSTNAYILAVTNVPAADTTAVPILLPGSTPVPFGEGSVATGYLTPWASKTSGSLTTAPCLRILCNSADRIQRHLIATNVGAPGFVDAPFVSPIPLGGNEFTSQDLYVVIGNKASLEESDSLALYDSGMVFGEDNLPGLGGTEVFIIDPVDGLIRGRNVGPFDLGLELLFSSAIEFEKVPDPNSAILLLFSLSIPITFRRPRKH